MKRTRQLASLGIMLIVVCGAAIAESDMKTVVTVLESRYSVHHHGVPGLWLAKPFLWGAGLGSLKMAVFQKFTLPAQDAYPLKLAVEQALGSDWSPFVETWSKTDGEWTTIFAKTVGDGLKFLIVTSDHEDGLTLLQVSVNGRAMRLWLDEPAECAQRVSGKGSKDAAKLDSR